MPQMAPMNWILLMIFILFNYLIMMTYLYFFLNQYYFMFNKILLKKKYMSLIVINLVWF